MNTTNIKSRNIAFVIVAVIVLFMANVSHATTVSLFTNITNNLSIDLSDQLSVDVSDAGTGVEFTFSNNIGIGSSMTGIYFDLGANTNLFSGISISEYSSGVEFDTAPIPANLPGGNMIGFTSDFGGDSTTPTAANGVDNAGEYISFLLTLGSGYSYDNALAAIFDDSLRIGMHMQSIDCVDATGATNDDCGSDSYVSAVPLPAAAWLFGSALIGFFATTRQRKS